MRFFTNAKLLSIVLLVASCSVMQSVGSNAEPYYANRDYANGGGSAGRTQINGRPQAVRPRPNLRPNASISPQPTQQYVAPAVVTPIKIPFATATNQKVTQANITGANVTPINIAPINIAPVKINPIFPKPPLTQAMNGEVVIIEAVEPPAIFSKNKTTSSSAYSNKAISNVVTPFANPANPANNSLPLNIATPYKNLDKSKAEYMPSDNYAQEAQISQGQTTQAQLAQPQIMPQAQNIPQDLNAPQKSASEYGWQQYIPPEKRNIAPQPAFAGRIYTGYRVDNANWNVAGDIAGQNPTKLSELAFEGVTMAEIGGEGEYTHRDGSVKGVHVEGSVYYAKGLSGETRDSDYQNAPPTTTNGAPATTPATAGGLTEISRSTSSNDDSDAMGYKIGGGYEIRMDSSDNQTKSYLTPIVGYSSQTTNYNMKNGVQVVPQTGAFQGLDSNYEMQWSGPFAGLKGGFKSGSHLLDFRGELHYANFEGTGEWNLRTSFNQPVSFINSGNGMGFELGGNYNYLFTDSGWGLFGGIKYRSFSLEDGIDTVIFSNGSTSSQKLNEVSWSSQLYRFGARYSF